MRVDVKKYLVIGPASQRSPFFEEIQREGIVEFISHEPPSQEVPTEIQTYMDALHVLRTLVPVKQVKAAADYRSAIVIARDIVERNAQLEKLREEARIIEKEIARVEPFGDFSIQTLSKIEKEAGRTLQFFFTKQGNEWEALKLPEVIYVGSAYTLDYYVAINKEPATYEGLIEMHIDRSLGELHEEQARIYRGIDEYETDIARFSHNRHLLKQGLTESLNRYHLEESEGRAKDYLGGDLFAVEGWVPVDKIALLEKIADRAHSHIAPIRLEEKDRPPTELENRGLARLGEDLINIYDTPSTTDRDPSLWVFLAFGLFFSMIVADAGYGVILLGISLFLFYKFGKRGGLGRRIILLSASLSIGCIVWGVLIASYLGIEVPPDSSLRSVSIINWMVKKKTEYIIENKGPTYKEWVQQFPGLQGVTDPETFLMKAVRKQDNKTRYVIYDEFTDNVMIELVIFIGTLHIILSFLRYLDKNWAGLGWVLFMVGAYLYFPSILKALSLIHYVFHIPPVLGAKIGQYILFCGIGLAALLALIQRRLGGLGEVMHVINVFADVMSYLRIYALSLAGMIMASTFDNIGTSVPIYVGVFIILAGHTVNFTLALMGGVIHGLRLNFIEWYHYSFEGGGRHFNPLTLLKID